MIASKSLIISAALTFVVATVSTAGSLNPGSDLRVSSMQLLAPAGQVLHLSGSAGPNVSIVDNAELTQASRQLQLARSTGSEDHLIAARRLLRDSGLPASDSRVQLLQAELLQREHQFDAALHRIDLILAQQPRNARALLLATAIHRVRGSYAKATGYCDRLFASELKFAAWICQADLASLSGNSSAYKDLTDSITSMRLPESGRLATWRWAQVVLGEMALRHGHSSRAEKHFAAALGAGKDVYVTTAFARALNAREEYERARQLIDQMYPNALELGSESLLIELAIACNGTNEPARAQVITTALQRNWAQADQLELPQHDRERARAAMYLMNQPDLAEQYAYRNWQSQREPIDLITLVAAATATDNHVMLGMARSFIERTGLIDVRVQSLLKEKNS